MLSDEPGASGRIAAFAGPTTGGWSRSGWCREGVDVPRLAVGVYATSASTPLFFAQAVGRFVRSRRPGETASVFLPSVPVLLGLASELEAQRDHVLGKPHRADEQWDDELLAAAHRQQDEPGEDEKAFTALRADAELDQLIYDGTSFGADEEDYLGLPGLLAPDQVRTLLSQRQKEWLTRPKAPRSGGPAGPAAARGAPALSVRERLDTLRKELNTLVALHNHRTKKPHGDDPQRAAARTAAARRRRWRPSSSSRSASPRSGAGAEPRADSRARLAGRGPTTTATGREPVGSRPVGASVAPALRAGLPDCTCIPSRGACPRAPRVVPAEQQLATLGEYGSDLCRRAATVAAVGEGQLGPGQGSGLHGGLPPSRHRV